MKWLLIVFALQSPETMPASQMWAVQMYDTRDGCDQARQTWDHQRVGKTAQRFHTSCLKVEDSLWREN
jgi:hypothetical protein